MALIPERRTGPGTLGVEKCLNDGVEQGRVTRAGAEKALAAVRRIMEENPGVSEGAAMSKAAQRLEIEAAIQKRQVAMQGLAVNRALEDARAHPNGIGAGVAALFARDISGRGVQFNVETRAASIRGQMHGMMSQALEAYRSTALGLRRDTLGLTRFVRELYGEGTGDGVAAAAAKGWTRATEFGVTEFNAAGGNLARKEAWRLPQSWDRDLVKAAGRDKFLDYMEKATADGRLRIWDWEADAPVDALRRAEILSNAYEGITDPLSRIEPGQSGAGKLANSRTDRRAFDWTSADAWLDFNRNFGVGDAGIFDAITGHIDSISKDIAMLQRLGPNPTRTAKIMIDTARKEGVEGLALHRLQARWDIVSGVADSPVAHWLASTMSSVRAWLSSAQLGSAILSSTTDFSTMRATAEWNGLSKNGVMGEYFQLLNPANQEHRMLAIRSGLIADSYAQRAQAIQRVSVEQIGRSLPHRMAGFVMRASGLEAHTQAAKHAFGMEFLGHLADQSGKAFDQLDGPMQRAMTKYGISPADWDIARTRGVYEEDGVRLIFPEMLHQDGADRVGVGVANRIMDMVNTERGFALIETSAADKALVPGMNLRPGSFEGELIRSMVQYKAFPIAMMARHLSRGMEGYRAGDHGKYMVGLVASLTLMGATAMQLKAIANGKDPRDMTDWKFWGAAFMQGGGAGIFGDFLNSATTRADQSLYMAFFAGPTGSLIDEAAKTTFGQAGKIGEDKETNIGRDMARFMRRNTPGTSLWYSRLALDRLLWDRLQEIADPNAGASFRRIEDKARKEVNQEFWWSPGQAAPARGPNAAAMLDTSR
jgi:hypothetical protein